MVKKLAVKHWLNILTFALILLVLFFARNDLVKAWQLLGQVNVWIFLAIIPLQFLSYYASGEMIFSYLKARGDLKDVPSTEKPKMALELNFVNHIFPSAGVSGASYMTYRLSKFGVNHGRAALAQVVRLAMQFASFAALMLIAVLWVTFDGDLTRATILIASSLLTAILAGIVGLIFLLGSRKRLDRFEEFLDNVINKKLAKFFRRPIPFIKRKDIHDFFSDLHDDYKDLRVKPKCLQKPFWWGVVFNVAETAMFFVSFWALGTIVNPAPILIGLGLAGLVGTFLVTPGGAGGYEAAIIFFLTIAGVEPAIAVAGVLLTRTSLIVLTIASGYFFYNSAMKKYAKHTN
jgi:uncharacterized protein (TIRG00374 family)